MFVPDIVKNDLVKDESSVWLLKQHSNFYYSDGEDSEKYLEEVFNKAHDLSSKSIELESYIKDWPSEYHLTTKRAQLFSGFKFDPSMKALEVGGGCGAITRYLGETFDDVVSIEGSINRARLARMRTRSLENVAIICAPFQELKFTTKFDIIFCVGVYEYSASFVSGDNPYNTVLEYFSDMLTPNGIVVIAIENQFGLKYFTSSREDHTGNMYEGIEGYHAHNNKVKTFGKNELEENLKKHFIDIKFFYPYPDYKLPTSILSNEFLSCGDAGELVSQIESRDYIGKLQPLWDEGLVSLELSKNHMLPFFANSYLVFSGKARLKGFTFEQLAILNSPTRVKEFRSQTRILRDKEGSVRVFKEPLFAGENKVGKLTLIPSNSSWKYSYSIQTTLRQNCMSKELTMIEMFMPCKVWVESLQNLAYERDGEFYLSGDHIDFIPSNAYIDASGIVSVIDKEWVWEHEINLKSIVIRGLYTFLYKIRSVNSLSNELRNKRVKALTATIANSLGVKLDDKDFKNFIKLESEFQSLITGSDPKREALIIRCYLQGGVVFWLSKKARSLASIYYRLKKIFSNVIVSSAR